MKATDISKAKIATVVGKSIYYLTKNLQFGGGTAAPGLYALKIDSNLLSYYLRQIPGGSIVIAGTNGKTTTSRIISQYFSQNAISFIHNRAGSNLERGLVSALLQKVTIFGKVKSVKYGLWEIDEAEFSRSIEKIQPHTVVLLNLFRDQLDRYGEVDNTRKKWEKVLVKLPTSAKIIYNGDDPQLVYLINTVIQARPDLVIRSYGMQGIEIVDKDMLNPLRLVLCPVCHDKLGINLETIIGQGQFKCAKCLFTNNRPNTYIDVFTSGLASSDAKGTIDDKPVEYKTNLAGLYNGYNVVAAITALNSLQFPLDQIIKSVEQIKGAFGRLEQVSFHSKKLILCLIKNPAGAYEMLKTVFHENFHDNKAVFLLNDNYADGKDVSWIWDIPFPEKPMQALETIYVSGSRKYDMALRIEHTGINRDTIIVKESIEDVLLQIKNDTDNETMPVFATYTAMLELQEILNKLGVKNKYWEE